MNWELIHELLDKLDSAVNSNSFWIELGIPDGEFDLEQTLIQHLKTGNFHFELVKQDINRDWNHFSEMVFPKNYEQPVLLQRPGNTWNGKENLKIEQISTTQVEEFLIDILTGSERFFSRSYLGSQLKQDEAGEITKKVINMLNKTDQNWTVYNIQPDFLNQVDDYYHSGYIKLGYFENCGRDLALCFKAEDHLYLLLTNGYS